MQNISSRHMLDSIAKFASQLENNHCIGLKFENSFQTFAAFELYNGQLNANAFGIYRSLWRK